MDAESAAPRIGTAERQQAYTQLEQHQAAGRIDLGEYDDRYRRITEATTQQEIDAVFHDLRTPEKKRRNAWRTSTLVLAVVCLALAGAVVVLARHRSSPTPVALPIPVTTAQATTTPLTPATLGPTTTAAASATSATATTSSAAVTPTTTPASESGPAPAVYTSGSVDVRIATGNGVVIQHPTQWYPLGGTGDLNPTPVALSPGDGAALSFFGAQQPSYQDCRARQDYAGAVPWTKIPSGSYVCVKITGNRIGQTRVDYRADPSGAILDVDLSGLVYEPTN
ncbi:DUF1707 SHOCT-like domain-containing protein [Nocardia sp. alder85J]|uniref:DUF1707 SHOCT-like domain-containing protein n=1 Tax=Nocardia sp. alder85J TaxID=2862949 RepID=UPI001CD471CC|nr:DUF1707 domain-containing protein [Nocardia sp. alder85J]MCX4093201.1 DUF1707 domain-containing protein [Nocardia sp. alder85J]